MIDFDDMGIFQTRVMIALNRLNWMSLKYDSAFSRI